MNGIALIVAAALALALVLFSAHQHGRACVERGGHIGPRSLCLSPDGRVLE